MYINKIITEFILFYFDIKLLNFYFSKNIYKFNLILSILVFSISLWM